MESQQLERKLKTKAFMLQLLSFVILFISFKYLAGKLLNQFGFLGSLISFVITIVIAPKFGVTKKDGEPLIAMSSLFVKGLKFFK